MKFHIFWAMLCGGLAISLPVIGLTNAEMVLGFVLNMAVCLFSIVQAWKGRARAS